MIHPPVGIPLVHILHHGLPLCNPISKLGTPEHWRKGHKWVHAQESDDATCIDCKNAYKRARGLRVKQP